MACWTQAALGAAKPDLVVSRLIIHGLGHNPYLVVPTSGHVPDIRVTVVTRNVGGATAPPSVTSVVLLDNRHRLKAVSDFDLIRVGALAPGQAQTNVAVLKHVKPHLGLVRVQADADFDFSVSETRQSNDRRTSPPIPVIARTWDVMTLTAHFSGAVGITVQDSKADTGFFFRFKSFNVHLGRFTYTATGRVTATATFAEPGCSGTGSTSAGHAPWPVATSSFNLSFGLDHYAGAVAASNEPTFNVPVTCEGGQTFNYAAKMLDLRLAPVVLYPYSTQISGMTSVSQPLGLLTYEWYLKADVP
jgi:hypothetical protein